jgi:acetyl esterase/lipase
MRKAFGLLSLVMLVALSCSASISQGKNDQEVDPTAIRRDQSITTFLPVQDIEYCKGGEIPLLLDIYIPEEPVLGSPMPAVIAIHGGAWASGSKSPISIDWLAQYGFLVVSINYRLSDVARFPAAVQDAKCAVRWLRANADKYNVNPDRIGIWGSSSGAHIAMMVGTANSEPELEGNGGWEGVSSRVQAVVSQGGISSLTALYEAPVLRPAMVQFLGASLEERPDLYKLASPTTYVSEDDPPLLLINDALDPVVPVNQGEIMRNLYIEAGAEAKLVNPESVRFHRPIGTEEEQLEAARITRATTLQFFIDHLGL